MTLQILQRQLDQVVLFTIDVRLVAGSKRANTEDIEQAKGVVLQQDEVLTLGSKKVFDPERLARLRRLRSAMHRHCREYGSAFLSGYAVPDPRADQVATRLQATVTQAQEEVADLLSNYQQILDEYCQARPAWAATIRAGAYSEQYLRSRISFGFNAVRIAAARDQGVAADNLQQEMGGLMGSVLADVAAESAALQRDSLQDRDSSTRKVLRPLRSAREKLSGFAFIDRRLASLAQMIDEVIASMPPEGPLRGTSLAMLHGICSILAVPARALDVAAEYEVHGRDALIASIRPPAPVLTPPPPDAVVLPVMHAFGKPPGLTTVMPAPQLPTVASPIAAAEVAPTSAEPTAARAAVASRRPAPRFGALLGVRSQPDAGPPQALPPPAVAGLGASLPWRRS